eukprot:CAMPEP_0202485772 /NCGR_PEP_ID=MMETSP1361-20130828/4517_1 /ASSEMBLY_ACC=CAM_ASM_000849 /TAXON_ID=210615 /ORGANISM="Staurosira complex sp., Strain CCMP2646" /LENGTH=357 /DNA_ID=CAMNT_0049114743 /DNA_START=429 /DNA_END=1502 /DNA_ORIENTATION=-
MNSVVVKLSAAVALALAVTIGLVGKRCPNLFLRIPNIGFIPWALTGNPIPPYFDPSIYAKEYFHEWAKDGDCIFASGPKSGTVWVHNIIHLLKNDGNDDFEYLLSEHNGITEFLLYPEHSVEMRINETQAKREKAKSRPVPAMTHFSHMSPSRNIYGMNVQIHPNIKYLVTLRNLKEVARSLYSFVNNFSPEFRKMWGGFPPPFSSPEDAVDLCIDKKELTFDHARGWWNVRSEPNVLLVHFADLKTHPRATIERIASFLDISVSDELMNVTLHKSAFDYMKNRVTTEHPEVYGCRNGRPGEPSFVSIVDHINKGDSDGADEFFTPEMEQKFRIAIEKYLGEYPDLIQWLETGGSYT